MKIVIQEAEHFTIFVALAIASPMDYETTELQRLEAVRFPEVAIRYVLLGLENAVSRPSDCSLQSRIPVHFMARPSTPLKPHLQND